MKYLALFMLFCSGLLSAQITVGGAIGYQALCTYNDGSVYDCTNKDIRGDVVVITSSNPSVVDIVGGNVGLGIAPGTSIITATVGTFKSTLTTTVTAALTGVTIKKGSVVTPVTPMPSNFGVTQENTLQHASENYPNYTYFVTGNSDYNVTSCSFYQGAGAQTKGAKWDCGVILAPTAATEASAWLCHSTFTTTSATSTAGFVTVPLSCTLKANTPYWVVVETDDGAFPSQGYYNCGGSCKGAAGSTTYPYKYAYASYGVYTGMPLTLSNGAATQMSAYVTATPITATPASSSVVTKGSTVTLSATCSYSDGTTSTTCPITWILQPTTAATLSTSGVLTGVSTGTAAVQAKSGSITSATLTIPIQ